MGPRWTGRQKSQANIRSRTALRSGDTETRATPEVQRQAAQAAKVSNTVMDNGQLLEMFPAHPDMGSEPLVDFSELPTWVDAFVVAPNPADESPDSWLNGF